MGVGVAVVSEVETADVGACFGSLGVLTTIGDS